MQSAEYAKEWYKLNALGGSTLPAQCQTLHATLMQLSYVANGYVNAGLKIAQSGSNRFLNELSEALGVLVNMNRILVNEPGTCR